MKKTLLLTACFALTSQLMGQTTVSLTDGISNAVDYDTTGNDITFTIDSGSADQTGTVVGTGNLIKTGEGTVRLTNANANTYTGNTDVQAGTLAIYGPNAGIITESAYVPRAINVGDANTASLTVSGGASIIKAGTIILGNTSAGNGTLSVADAPAYPDGETITLFNFGDVLVGNEGSGTLNISSRGYMAVIDPWAPEESNLRLGAGAGGSGNVMVDDATLTVSGTLRIAEGQNATGSVTINNNSSVYTTNLEIGVAAGSHGELSINSGSILSVNRFSVGEGTTTVTIDGGTLKSNSTALTTDAPIVIKNDATFYAGGYAGDNMELQGEISGDGRLVKTGGLNLTLTADNSYTGGTFVDWGTLTLGAGGTSGSVLGNISFDDSSSSLVFNRSDDHTYQGVVSGIGNLVKINTNTLTLTADHSYTEGTTVSAGTLTLGVGGETGSVLGDIANSGTVVMNRSGDHTYNGVVSGSGNLVHNGAILRLSSAQTYTGTTTLNSGFLVLPLDVDQGLSASTIVEIASGATLDISNRALTIAGLSGAGNVYSFGDSEGALTVNTAPGESQTFSGALGSDYPNFSLTKAGEGTLTLTGANTYTGSTTINGGILNINGSTASAITINVGGTLGGNGTFIGLVTVAGTLAPGESPGTLHFTNDLTLEDSATLNMEITGNNPGEFDILNGNGSNSLILDGILAIDNTGYTGVWGDSITVFTNWDTVSGTFSSITGTDLEDGLEWDTSNIYSSGTLSVIPEPSSVLLLLSSLVMITLLKKSKKGDL